jgi:UDP-N-acetylglucosamine--N-acetylmuramyl-(pentapeptide) pyrophosphoryl-undecaprenol N-acetylglucosamine transferase
MKALMATGTTGGHVFPAFSLAAKLVEIDPSTEIIFVGREEGPERTWVEEKHWPYEGIRAVPGKVRRGFAGTLRALRDAYYTKRECAALVKRARPDVAVGFGGFVSGPMLLAARSAGIPTVIHEGNAVPGRVNRWLGSRVSRVFVGHESETFSRVFKRLEVVGVPVRPNVVDCRPDPSPLGLLPGVPTVLVVGGSLGARRLCYAAVEAFRRLAKEGVRYQALLQTGSFNYDSIHRLDPEAAVRVVEFIGDMGNAYACADIVVSRAGMSSIAEITANGLPSILVPYPYAADDHQRRNAEMLERKGAAHMILDQELSGECLANWLKLLLPREEERHAMGLRARSFHHPDAAERMARSILELVSSRKHEERKVST